MGLEEKLSELENEREKPSFWKGFLKTMMSPVGAGLFAGIYAYTLHVQGVCELSDVFLSGVGIGAAVGIAKELIYGTSPPIQHKNKIVAGAALFHVTVWNSVDAEQDYKLLFCSQYAIWQGCLSTTQLMQQYTLTSSAAQKVRKHTNLLTTIIGGATFSYYGIQFGYGYEHFPAATFSLNATLAATAALLMHTSLIGISTLLDKQTYIRIADEARFFWHYFIGNKSCAAITILQQETTDLYVKATNAKRIAHIESGQNRMDSALLALADVTKEKKHAVDLVGRIISTPQRLWQWQSSIFSASGMQFEESLRGAHELSLAIQNVIDENYDFALRILYKCEKYDAQPEAIALLSAIVHDRMKSPKTLSAYRYAAAKVALKTDLLSNAGKSIRAKTISPETNAFLANNFIHYFGELDMLQKQELVRQQKQKACAENSTVPALVLPPTELLNGAFSTYMFAQGIHLSQSTKQIHFHSAARTLGRFHKLITTTEKPRDYRAVLTERVVSLPVSSLLLQNWNVLWKYMGNDYCIDNDLHGNQVIISGTDKVYFLDHKPRQPNHRIIDIAKLIAHTGLFSQNHTAQNKLLDTYERASSVRPDFLSLQCAFPIVALNSLYWHQKGIEPGFCPQYIINACHALSYIRKNHSAEYEKDAESFQKIEKALNIVKKQLLSESQSLQANAV